MKRLIGLLITGSLMLALSVGLIGAVNTGTTSATLSPTVDFSVTGFYAIYIPSGDTSVNLGTIDSSCYDITTDTWCAISDGNTHTVWAFTNFSGGLKLTVSAADTGTDTIDSLADLHIKGGDIGTFAAGHLDSPKTLKTTSSAGIVKVTDIEYEYQADVNDTPGTNYQATLTYTVTSP